MVSVRRFKRLLPWNTGPHSGPASVIWNWKREIERFAPKLKVNVYHGPNRKFSAKDDVVITSHGTLRQDAEDLAKEEWAMFVVTRPSRLRTRRVAASRRL